jgi:uncharacterized SAM-binding protein YcdF (DUF218 family)
MKEVALNLGVAAEDILLEINSKDTHDQARLIREVANFDENKRFILVTTASHMPRSVALFKQYGLQPVPAPIDFWVKTRKSIDPRDFFPTSSGVQKMERVFHEYLGITWGRLKQKYEQG